MLGWVWPRLQAVLPSFPSLLPQINNSWLHIWIILQFCSTPYFQPDPPTLLLFISFLQKSLFTVCKELNDKRNSSHTMKRFPLCFASHFSLSWSATEPSSSYMSSCRHHKLNYSPQVNKCPQLWFNRAAMILSLRSHGKTKIHFTGQEYEHIRNLTLLLLTAAFRLRTQVAKFQFFGFLSFMTMWTTQITWKTSDTNLIFLQCDLSLYSLIRTHVTFTSLPPLNWESRFESILRRSWQMLLKINLNIPKLWMKSVSMKPLTSSSHHSRIWLCPHKHLVKSQQPLLHKKP